MIVCCAYFETIIVVFKQFPTILFNYIFACLRFVQLDPVEMSMFYEMPIGDFLSLYLLNLLPKTCFCLVLFTVPQIKLSFLESYIFFCFYKMNFIVGNGGKWN